MRTPTSRARPTWSVVGLEAQVGAAVPEDVGQRVGQLAIVVELGAQAEQLARLAQDEGARQAGGARAARQQRRDAARALEVAGEGGLERGQLGAARQARREGDLGQRGVAPVAGLRLAPRAQHHHVAAHRARVAPRIPARTRAPPSRAAPGTRPPPPRAAWRVASSSAARAAIPHVTSVPDSNTNTSPPCPGPCPCPGRACTTSCDSNPRAVRVQLEAALPQDRHHPRHVERLGRAHGVDRVPARPPRPQSPADRPAARLLRHHGHPSQRALSPRRTAPCASLPRLRPPSPAPAPAPPSASPARPPRRGCRPAGAARST